MKMGIDFGILCMKQRWIENLRGLAAISVIAIHSLNSALLIFGGDDKTTISYVLNKAFMNLLWWGVPCFLMITGYLLLNPDKDIPFEKLMKKYVWRIMVVLFTFGTVFSWMEIIFYEKVVSVYQIGKAVLNVFEGKSWAHLWYLYALIGLYLLLPIYKLISKNITDNDLLYFIIICFVFLFIISKLSLFKITSGFYINWGVYPFWLFLGYAKRRKLFVFTKQNNILLLLLSILAFILLSIACYSLGVDRIETFFGYDSPIVVVMTNSIFNLFMNIDNSGEEECGTTDTHAFVSNILYKVANNSFGIYIIHMFFVNMFYKVLKINPFSFGIGTGVILLLIVVNLILSYVGTTIMKKMPILKNYI